MTLPDNGVLVFAYTLEIMAIENITAIIIINLYLFIVKYMS